MTLFNQEFVRRLSSLSCIALSEDEVESMTEDLKGILEHIEAINKLDLSHDYDVAIIDAVTLDGLREDEICNNVTQSELLENAPEHIAGLVKVPSVMK